jgi:lysophospholipase L1-like esterase
MLFLQRRLEVDQMRKRLRFPVLAAMVLLLLSCDGEDALNPLANWFNGGISGKTVVVWGNSTVSHAVYFFQRLRGRTAAGDVLEGLNPEQILNYGNNGATLAALLDGQGQYPVAAVIAAQPDLLIIRGPLINDVRLGTTTLEQATALLKTALDRIRAGSPHTSILLTTENSLLSSDPGGFGWVQPPSQAQHYTNILRDAVLSFDGRYPNVKVYDLMTLEYGVVAPESSPLMANQLHPSEAGQEAEANLIAGVIGRQGN